MLKGTNRQVLEITQTDCEYFEKVLFFVKPEYVNVSEGKLRERACAIAGTDTRPPAMKIRSNKLKLAAILVSAAVFGAAVAAAVGALFF